MASRNEVYKLIAKALTNVLPDNGEAEIGQDHNRMFLRVNDQVFAITVEDRLQINTIAKAKGFMVTLPYPYTPE